MRNARRCSAESSPPDQCAAPSDSGNFCRDMQLGGTPARWFYESVRRLHSHVHTTSYQKMIWLRMRASAQRQLLIRHRLKFQCPCEHIFISHTSIRKLFQPSRRNTSWSTLIPPQAPHTNKPRTSTKQVPIIITRLRHCTTTTKSKKPKQVQRVQ